MNRIGFFLDNRAITSVDCSNVLNFNPGIGGTEYLIIAISALLSSRNNGLEVILYTTSEGVFPPGLRNVGVEDLEEAALQATHDGCECLIFKHDASLILEHALDKCPVGLKLIPWCHVFVCYWELDFYATCDSVYRIVYVGREMMDLYRDHQSFRKSTYIYNCLNLSQARSKVDKFPFEARKNIVTYIGSITPFKGLHLLAKAWPKVVEQIPDAELYIIGSGRLYDEKAQMGSLGIAESQYETRIMQYLGENGKVRSDVHFMGLMGEEKNDILLQTKVGVPNPSGITETFGLSAVEMQMMGAVVATKKCPGYLDTVLNGRLYSNVDALAATIVSLLKSNTSNYESAMCYFEQNFSMEVVAKRWEDWLVADCVVSENAKLTNKWYRLKLIKEVLRKIKEVFPSLYCLPPIERILLFLEKCVGKRGCRYIDSNAA